MLYFHKVLVAIISMKWITDRILDTRKYQSSMISKDIMSVDTRQYRSVDTRRYRSVEHPSMNNKYMDIRRYRSVATSCKILLSMLIYPLNHIWSIHRAYIVYPSLNCVNVHVCQIYHVLS